MTAINLVCCPKANCIWIGTDAASYSDDGVVRGIASKISPIAAWPAVIANRGMVGVSEIAARVLPELFSNFGEMIAGIETELPRIVAKFKFKHSAELIMAGFSARGPETWFIKTANDPKGPYWPAPNILIQMPNVCMGPVPCPDLVQTARFAAEPENDDPGSVARWLVQLLELQRHSEFDGKHWIGGFGEVTTLTPDGIEQRMSQRWPEDRIGERIKPRAADWTSVCQ